MKTHLLAEHGKTAWRIVMAHPAHETVKLACDELFHFVMQMSGAALPVQTELVADGEYATADAWRTMEFMWTGTSWAKKAL